MLACRDANIADIPEFAAGTCSAILGSTHGSANYSEAYSPADRATKGFPPPIPCCLPKAMPNAGAAHQA